MLKVFSDHAPISPLLCTILLIRRLPLDKHATLLQPPAIRSSALASGEDEFLVALGKRVRSFREQRAISRKQLARDANVSERYLGQLETGEGNISILLLRRIAAAMNVTLLMDLFVSEHQATAENQMIRRLLALANCAEWFEDAIVRLVRDFGHEDPARAKRVALIGLRGAGKSTLGAMLAKELGWPVVELSRQIERETALPINEIIALYGQNGLRRLERKTLERIVADPPPMVLVVGGGLVAEETTFNLLLAEVLHGMAASRTPKSTWRGSLRKGTSDRWRATKRRCRIWKRILESRVPLYRKADAMVDTSGDTPV